MEVGKAIKMFRNCCTNINNNLIFFRDKIEILTISLFETKLRFVPSISRAPRQAWEFVLSNLEFQEGDWKDISLLNLTRFFEIKKSRQALLRKCLIHNFNVFWKDIFGNLIWVANTQSFGQNFSDPSLFHSAITLHMDLE